MRRSIGNTAHISQLVKQLFKDNAKAQDKLQVQDIKAIWGKVAGERALGSTKKLYKKANTLFVKIESPMVKHDLLYKASGIIERLNSFLSEESKIKNIFWY